MFNKNRTKAILSSTVILIFMVGFIIANESDAASNPTGKTEKTKAAISFSKDTNCASCHKSYVESMQDANLLIYKHAETTGDCFGCHDEADLKAVHAKVTKPPRKFFRQRKYPNDMCLSCHDGYENLVEETKDSTVFTTVQGKVINPHDTHVGQVECLNCHKMHRDKPPIDYCYGCHHPRQLNNCKDCHSPQKE